jgi:hypothetical protein
LFVLGRRVVGTGINHAFWKLLLLISHLHPPRPVAPVRVRVVLQQHESTLLVTLVVRSRIILSHGRRAGSRSRQTRSAVENVIILQKSLEDGRKTTTLQEPFLVLHIEIRQ